MEEIFQKAVKHNEEMRKPLSSVPWKPDEPHPQPYYVFDHASQDWVEEQATPAEDPDAKHGGDTGSGAAITRLALYSWNIDFMLPHPGPRMRAALAHLESLISGSPSAATGVVVYLQECVESDLAAVGATGWVRERFAVTDRDAVDWASGHYGTVTLVDRRLLPLAACFRVHYALTRMERDALFVDVWLRSSSDDNNNDNDNDNDNKSGGDKKKKKKKKLVRLCNTHLESLADEPPYRPPQMRLAAAYLRGENNPNPVRGGESESVPYYYYPAVHGALAAGDFNAIQPFDRALHADNGLRDAYLESGGREDSDGGYTWGQQAAPPLRALYGCSRMDKVFFRGGLRLLRFARFGADVLLDGDPAGTGAAADLLALGFERPWITDHLGVMAEVEVVDSID
ncbi:hypothetical protein F5X99DRAFT_409264 [Biscogniauxia marginata]|nr:hypothetical protein F5X99DRAFT_409264 [Biscogniauxia marginata]